MAGFVQKKEKMVAMRFEPVQIHFSEKHILGLGAL